MSTGASFKRGKSKQDYSTPEVFMAPVRARFGHIAFDLAADAANTKAADYFDITKNSLIQPWHEIRCAPGEWLWLNPPFANITPWAAKCAFEASLGARILFLVPAAVGSNWHKNYLHHRAAVLFLNGRIPFDPANPDWGYPKDCLLACFGLGVTGYECWKWK